LDVKGESSQGYTRM